MDLLVEVVLGLILAILVYFGIHYFVVNRPAKSLRLKTQKIVDTATNYAIQKQAMISNNETINSSYNAGVWGRGVMAFEYHLKKENDLNESLMVIKQKLEAALNEYGVNNDLESVDDSKYFAITDMWLMENQLYFDVAYLRNQVTREYVADLNKLDE